MSENLKSSESGIGLFASKHIEEKCDPHSKLQVLTNEQIDIVVERIYQRLQEQKKQRPKAP